MNSLRFAAVLAMATAVMLSGSADAQDEASPDAAAAICKAPQCPGLVSAWQKDIKACEAKTARIKEVEDVVSELQGKLEKCAPRAADAPTSEDLAKAVEMANAWKAEADRIKAEKDKLQEQVDTLAALRKEVERLSEENSKLKQPAEGATPEAKKQPASDGKSPKQTAQEEAKKQQATDASTAPPSPGSECAALGAVGDNLCLVRTPAPGWLMARSRDKADQGSALFLRPLIDPGIIPRLPSVAGNAECGPLRDVLKALEPLDPRPSVDAVFVRSGDLVAQCYDNGDGGWRVRPVAKGDRKLEAWILIPEAPPKTTVRP
jgi:hypothetical protein